MFLDQSAITKGGLASYNVSHHEVGRVSAKYVQRILTGVKPKDLPVEGVDKIELIIRQADRPDDSAECARPGNQGEQVMTESQAAMPGLN